MPAAILVVFLIVLVYIGTFAFNRRYPEMEGDLEHVDFHCINCPTKGSCTVSQHQKNVEEGEVKLTIYEQWKADKA